MKLFIGISSVAACTLLAANLTAGSPTAPVIQSINNTIQQETEPLLGDDSINNAEVSQARYYSFSGIVKEITPFFETNGTEVEKSQFVLVENEEGGQEVFLVTEKTLFVSGNEVIVGDKVIGFYDANGPERLIYPPQHDIRVLAVNFPEGRSIKVDYFDENLVSADNQLKLNIAEDTEILSQNGNAYVGGLTNQKLVVIYDFTTRSIPAQTTPIKIIVLSEEEPIIYSHSDPELG